MKIPTIHNFKYDAFQENAIQSVTKGHSLIVSAPTGAGKTVIAEYVCNQSMGIDKGIIYTAPVKALSNQKYRDFSEIYGKENVGILTGDVSINPTAPILIMTTEIFRNRLFEPEDLFDDKEWVIFDEVHYLDDINRGTVWEESLIFFPENMKILALSATIPNIEELAAWIESIHNNTVDVIIESHRPVPLSFKFMINNSFFNDLDKKTFKKILATKSKHLPQNRMDKLVYELKKTNGFPAIYFIFSRKRCEGLAKQCKKFNLITASETKNILEFYDQQLQAFQLENDPHAEDMRVFVKKGIAFHHAGILPPLKEIIERLFTHRMLKLIFTTETFALGINMPAKTVIFDQLRKFYGTGFDFLKTRDFFQMAGRAGRRGFDTKGNVYSMVIPGRIPHNKLKRVLFGTPEAVYSQFNSNYATVLNLYDSLGEKVLSIYPKSFHSFQSEKKKQQQGLYSLKNKLTLLKFSGYIDEAGLTSRGHFARKIYGYELQAAELFFQGFFEEHIKEDIVVMLTAMIYEPRKQQKPPHLSKHIRKIKRIADKTSIGVQKTERLFKMETLSKRFNFHMSEAILAWMKGTVFEDLHHYTDVDEGEIIRNFRMVLQILRQILHMKDISENFHDKVKEAIYLIKRDIIDPESQFELG